ncbi:cytochrome P450 [Trametes gibbosa]|nr:cytochrome P450 [Trametes gibbosa]
MLAVTAMLIALAAISSIVYRSLQKRRYGPLPPGPPGYPLIGNLFDMPTAYHWLTFAEWGQRWGIFTVYPLMLLWLKHPFLGDIVSVSFLGQPMVVLNSPEDAADLLEKKSAIYSSRAPVPVAGEMIGWTRAMILAPYGDRLREMRRMAAQVLASRQSVARFHPLLESETRAFLVKLRRGADSLVNDLHTLSTSAIATITYGYKVQGDDDVIVQLVDKSMKEFSEASTPGAYLADTFPFLRFIPSWLPGTQWKRKVAEQAETFERMIDLPFEWTKAQIKAGVALPSFTSELLETNAGKNNEDLIKMAAVALYAGSTDTTVAVLSTFFLAMSCFPEAQRKAQAEIDAVIGNDRLPTIEDRERLPYLNALVLEVLRWIPVAPIGFPHQLTEDDFHRGYFLPKGTIVMANVWRFLHDPETYADPITFNPDRFIATKGREPERDPRDFCFGFGRRRCPGVFFAEASVVAASSMVLAIYNISKATEDGRVVEPSKEGVGSLISHPRPFKCTVTVRSDKARALLDSLANGN